MNRSAKILSLMLIGILTIINISNPSNAAEIPTAKFGGEDTKIANVGGIILGVATTVGMVVAVIMLVFLAIKYMSSSPNDKAEIKKHMVVWIVGAVLLFAASGVVKLIQGFGNEVNKQLGGEQTTSPKTTPINKSGGGSSGPFG